MAQCAATSWESAPDTHHHSHSDASAWDLWEVVGTYPKSHTQMLAKVPKMPPKYPTAHAQMLAKVPKMPPKYLKCHFRWRHNLACPCSMVSPEYLVGISCAAAQTMLSGFASIYFEMVPKRRSGGGGGGGGGKVESGEGVGGKGGSGGSGGSGGGGGGGSGLGGKSGLAVDVGEEAEEAEEER
jgi:hypothetical protein